jgi:hypothetical protein
VTVTTYNLTLKVDRIEAAADPRDPNTVVTVATVASLASLDPATVGAALRAVADQVDPPRPVVAADPVTAARELGLLGRLGVVRYARRPVHACAEKSGAIIIGPGDTMRCGCTPCSGCGIVPDLADGLCACPARATDTEEADLVSTNLHLPLLFDDVQIITSRNESICVGRRDGGRRPPVKIAIFRTMAPRGATPHLATLRLTDAEAARLAEVLRQAANPVD